MLYCDMQPIYRQTDRQTDRNPQKNITHENFSAVL
jgi:hypothetical protein